MTNDISASTTAISASRVAVNRIISSRLRRPVGDPQTRRVLVAGRVDSGEPFRQDEGIRAEIERQRRQLARIETLGRGPQGLALAGIELDLERVDQAVHF